MGHPHRRLPRLNHPPRPALIPHTAAVTVGWRYWRLPAGTARLRSVNQRGIDWVPGEALAARCGTGHPAPAGGCACGIYATLQLATLLDHGLCLGPDPMVLGTVTLWGEVIDDGGGSLRGQFAYPADLGLIVGATGPAGDPAPGLARLRAYGVPARTFTAAEAIGDISSRMAEFLAMSRPARPLPRNP